jgi:ArsR family metal-binding transcriptional regulator
VNNPLFLGSIVLDHTFPCLAEPGKIIVIGEPCRSLYEVIPYLASLPGVIAYNPDIPVLTFRRQPGFLTIYPDRVVITQVKDAGEGLDLLSALKDAINAVWDRRHELNPVASRRMAARPLDVWALLPQTNCGQCGEATCMAFAFLLIQGKRSLEECPSLQADPAFNNQRATLESVV